jgi:hypothetical protein
MLIETPESEKFPKVFWRFIGWTALRQILTPFRLDTWRTTVIRSEAQTGYSQINCRS